MFPFKSEAVSDNRITNPLLSEEKKVLTYFKSDWTCFKGNNSVLPIGHKSYQTHVSIKNCLSRRRRNGRVSITRFNFSDHPYRLPQTPATRVFMCLRLAQAYQRSCRRPIADRCRSYENQA